MLLTTTNYALNIKIPKASGQKRIQVFLIFSSQNSFIKWHNQMYKFNIINVKKEKKSLIIRD